MNKEGVITQLIGAVVDVKFKDNLPEIYTALEANNGGNKLILEVAQHLGENSVRTIASRIVAPQGKGGMIHRQSYLNMV